MKVWFQNRRIKWRKQHLEIQQQRLAAIKQQNQKGDAGDSDQESGDSNNYSFSMDSNENGSGSNKFFKAVDSDPKNINQSQYRDELVSFHEGNPNDTSKNESNGENV